MCLGPSVSDRPFLTVPLCLGPSLSDPPFLTVPLCLLAAQMETYSLCSALPLTRAPYACLGLLPHFSHNHRVCLRPKLIPMQCTMQGIGCHSRRRQCLPVCLTEGVAG